MMQSFNNATAFSVYPVHYYYKQAFSWHLGELYRDL